MSEQSDEPTTSASSATSMIRHLLEHYRLPGFDLDAFVQARQDDIDAISRATAVAFKGAQTIAKTHANQVDLGGYLANRSDGAVAWPGRQLPPAGLQADGSAPQFATLPQQANQFVPAGGSFGSWTSGDALLAEQNVDPLLAG